MVLKCWRARISVGAISAACRPASITAAAASKRHHGLARADIALQQPHHALGLAEIGDDGVERARLRQGERIGQGRDDRLAQMPVAGMDAAGPLAVALAQQRQRQLARQQFVIGEARAGRARRIDIRHLRPGDGCRTAPARRTGNSLRLRNAASCHSGSAGTFASAASIALCSMLAVRPSVSG